MLDFTNIMRLYGPLGVIMVVIIYILLHSNISFQYEGANLGLTKGSVDTQWDRIQF